MAESWLDVIRGAFQQPEQKSVMDPGYQPPNQWNAIRAGLVRGAMDVSPFAVADIPMGGLAKMPLAKLLMQKLGVSDELPSDRTAKFLGIDRPQGSPFDPNARAAGSAYDFGRSVPPAAVGVAQQMGQFAPSSGGPQFHIDQDGKIVWHGSPHKFDKFDSSKIGAGEGAQAYGHGLYVAENPQVAKTYQNVDPTVPPPPVRTFMGAELTPGTPEYHAATLVKNSTLGKVRKEVSGWIADASNRPEMAKEVDNWRKTLETLNVATSKSDFKELRNTGNLYKADLADSAIPKMLDWDKPLSQQSKELQNLAPQFLRASIPAEGLDMGGGRILSNAGRKLKPDSASPWVLKTGDKMFDISQADVDRMLIGDSGKALYTRMTASLGGQDKVAEFLKKQGIPGIRYLDGGSRGAAAGTSNYVVFPGNENLLKILERNGVPVK